jgi:imidazolonepropionase-like amidohydrolase
MRSLLLLPVCALAASAAVAIQDVTVIDVAAGKALPHMTVVVDGERITAAGPLASTRVPANARLVSGRGRFLIPGLWDMHVHLWNKENQLPAFLAFGVTGVQDMGSDYDRVMAWREEIETGKAPGPHVVTSGPPVAGDDSSSDQLPVLVARTAIEARQAFDQLWNLEVDFVNVLPGLSRDAYFALAEQARHWDLRLVGDTPASVSAQEAIEARQISLEHLAGVMTSVSTDVDAVEFFRECAKRGARLTPMLTWWRRNASLDDDAATRERAERIYRLVALMKDTQVEILAGTDTGDPHTSPGATLHEELQQLVAAGLTPRDALEAATLAPARLLGWDDAMGAIEPGKLADMVLVNGNPLVDIGNTRKIAAVFARGKYYARKDLDAILAAVSSEPRP